MLALRTSLIVDCGLCVCVCVCVCRGAEIVEERQSEMLYYVFKCTWDCAVAQLVEALRYKPEGCGFHFRWRLSWG